MNKKLVSIIVALVLIVAVAVGTTLAYLTDRDAEVNVFTVGDVQIEVNENFNQGEELMPGITVTKEVSIENTGKNNAWIWYSYAVPVLDADGSDLIEVTVANDALWVELCDSYTMEIEGELYNVYTYGWPTYVAPGESTGTGMASVALNKWIDYNVNDSKWYHVHNGVVTEVMDVDNARVYVTGYAIQEIGLVDIHAAFAAFNEQWGNPSMDLPMDVAPVTAEIVLDDTSDASIYYVENIEADTVAITVGAESGTDYVVAHDVVIVAENDMTLYSEKDLGVYMSDCQLNVGGGIVINANNGTVLIADCDFVLGDGKLVELTGAGQVLIGTNVTVNGVTIDASNVNDYVSCAGHVDYYGQAVNETIDAWMNGEYQ